MKVGARVVPGTIERDPGGKQYAFNVTDGAHTFPVVYRGIAPDTFTDSVDVVVERTHGRGRHLPGDRAARQVRVALRERADEIPQTSTSRRRATRPRRGTRVILIGELSLWVALLMAAWSTTVSFAGGALRRTIWSRSGVRGLYATFAMVVLASIGLWTALLHARLLARVRREPHQLEHAERLRLHGVLERAGGIDALLGADPVDVLDDRRSRRAARRNRELTPWATGTLSAILLFFIATTVLQGESVRRASTSCRSTARE